MEYLMNWVGLDLQQAGEDLLGGWGETTFIELNSLWLGGESSVD